MKSILSTTAIAALLMSGAAFAESHTSEGDEEMTSETEMSSDTESSSDTEESSDTEMSLDAEAASDTEEAGTEMASDSEMSGDTGPFGTYEDQEELEIFASDFIGKRIYSAEGEISMGEEGGINQDWNDLGEVNDLLMGAQDGQIDYAILGIGGFLGIGERDVLVKMDQIEIVQDGDDATDYFLVINATQEQIENAPEFDSTVVNEAEAAAAEAGAEAENAAEETGEVAEETGEVAEEAAEETEQAAEEAAAETEEAVAETEQAAEEAAAETEQAAEEAAAETEAAAEEAEAEVEEETAN